PRPWDGRVWSPALTELTDPEVRKLYLQFVGQDTSTEGTAADTWENYPQRIRFFFAMSRSRSDDSYLIECCPFTEAQKKQILAGIKPDQNDLCFEGNCCGR